jgi:hypothetical protein
MVKFSDWIKLREAVRDAKVDLNKKLGAGPAPRGTRKIQGSRFSLEVK